VRQDLELSGVDEKMTNQTPYLKESKYERYTNMLMMVMTTITFEIAEFTCSSRHKCLGILLCYF